MYFLRTNIDFLTPSNDALFGLVDKLINTGYLSSKLALSKIRSQNKRTKKIEDQIEKLLEQLPSFPVPFLDEMRPIPKDHEEET